MSYGMNIFIFKRSMRWNEKHIWCSLKLNVVYRLCACAIRCWTNHEPVKSFGNMKWNMGSNSIDRLYSVHTETQLRDVVFKLCFIFFSTWFALAQNTQRSVWFLWRHNFLNVLSPSHNYLSTWSGLWSKVGLCTSTCVVSVCAMLI